MFGLQMLSSCPGCDSAPQATQGIDVSEDVREGGAASVEKVVVLDERLHALVEGRTVSMGSTAPRDAGSQSEKLTLKAHLSGNAFCASGQRMQVQLHELVVGHRSRSVLLRRRKPRGEKCDDQYYSHTSYLRSVARGLSRMGAS